MSFSRYASYKDSGVQSIGRVPEHWQVRQLRDIGRLLKGSGGSKEDIVEDGVQCVRYGDLYTTHSFIIRQSRTRVSRDLAERYTPLRYGDVLFACSGETFEEIGKSAVCLIDGEVCCGGDIAILRPSIRVVPAFLGFASDSLPSMQQKASMGRGTTVKHIYPDELRHLAIAVPPLNEQHAIADFIERETAKIDDLVADQQRLIQLLDEQQKAVIAHVVTKGLNLDAPMKQSGVQWLGDVPAHWRCVRNKVVFREIDDRADTDDGELLTVSHITGVTPRSEKDVNMFLAETLEGYKRCQRGDLVINTMWAWMGALGCSPCDGVVSPSYNVYRPQGDGVLSPEYYDYLCRIPSHRVAMKAQSRGVWESRLRLYPQAFLDMRVALPPYEEQTIIVRHLQEQTARAEVLIRAAEQAIKLLEERRTALISAAVTGEIDVRALATAEVA